jgi:hypothetical protein
VHLFAIHYSNMELQITTWSLDLIVLYSFSVPVILDIYILILHFIFITFEFLYVEE